MWAEDALPSKYNTVRAFILGNVNGTYRKILASKYKTTLLLGLVLIKSFTIVLQWTFTYTSYYSPIGNLNFIFLLGSIYYFNELNKKIKVEMLGVL